MVDAMEIVNQPVVLVVKLAHRDRVVQFLPVIVQSALRHAHSLVKIVAIHFVVILAQGLVEKVLVRITALGIVEPDVHKGVLLDVN